MTPREREEAILADCDYSVQKNLEARIEDAIIAAVEESKSTPAITVHLAAVERERDEARDEARRNAHAYGLEMAANELALGRIAELEAALASERLGEWSRQERAIGAAVSTARADLDARDRRIADLEAENAGLSKCVADLNDGCVRLEAALRRVAEGTHETSQHCPVCIAETALSTPARPAKHPPIISEAASAARLPLHPTVLCAAPPSPAQPATATKCGADHRCEGWNCYDAAPPSPAAAPVTAGDCPGHEDAPAQATGAIDVASACGDPDCPPGDCIFTDMSLHKHWNKDAAPPSTAATPKEPTP